MKYLKSFESSSLNQPAIVDDIRDLYIEFRDEWGFTEASNTHNPGYDECIWISRLSGNPQKFGSYFFIRISFKIKSQDNNACYENFIEMCDRIKSLEDIRVEYSKFYSDVGNLFFSVNIVIPM